MNWTWTRGVFGWDYPTPSPDPGYAPVTDPDYVGPPTDRSQLGAAAQRLINDPVLTLAFDRVAEKLTKTWQASDPSDSKGRERVYAMHHALSRVRSELNSLLGNAKLIEAEQKRREAEEAEAQRRRDRALGVA